MNDQELLDLQERVAIQRELLLERDQRIEALEDELAATRAALAACRAADAPDPMPLVDAGWLYRDELAAFALRVLSGRVLVSFRDAP